MCLIFLFNNTQSHIPEIKHDWGSRSMELEWFCKRTVSCLTVKYSSLWIKFICFSVLKTGLNIILACSIPKNSPMLEVWSLSHSLSLMYVCVLAQRCSAPSKWLSYCYMFSQLLKSRKWCPLKTYLRIYIVVLTFYLDINNHFTILA